MAAWKNMFIPYNKFSNPQRKLNGVRKLVLHYTANPGGTALNHYNYFKNLKGRYASAHIFVDKNEAICIIPLNMIAYHANDGTYRGVPELKPDANYLSVGVEMCQEKDGSFHPETIRRTEDVMVELCKQFNLNPLKDIVRHWDITRKNCPAPWVSNSSLFASFKQRVNSKLNLKNKKELEEKVVTKLTEAQEKMRKYLMDLGITDGKNPTPEKVYMWSLINQTIRVIYTDINKIKKELLEEIRKK